MNNSVVIPINHIERKPNSEKYRIVDKGVTVEFLAQFLDDPDWPVSRICANYDLTPGEVFAAWAFYSDHKEEIDRHIAESHQSNYSAEDERRRQQVTDRRSE